MPSPFFYPIMLHTCVQCEGQLRYIISPVGVMQDTERELDFTRFCSYSVAEVLGAAVQGEHLYIVQAQKISVYEYHGKFDRPQLSEELIHNTPILDYALSHEHIALRTNALVEVRHRKHWEHLVLTRPLAHPENYLFLWLDQQALYLAHSDSGSLLIEKIDMESRAVGAVINLGKMGERGGEWSRRVRPILLGEMGVLSDFYIWAKGPQEVELGMLYTNSGSAKRKFEINQIAVPQGRIMQMYHHRVTCVKYPKQSPEYVVLILHKDAQPQMYLQLYEIMPREHAKRNEEPAADFHGQFQSILNQFSFLKNLNERSSSSPSLVQEVLSQAIADGGSKAEANGGSKAEANGGSKAEANFFEVRLQGMVNYTSSFYGDGKLWVISDKRICKVQLVTEQSIEVIVRSYRSEMKVIKSIAYQEKPVNKHCLGLYQDTLLFSEITTSFDIAAPRSPPEEIAEEIEVYEINDEILEKEAEIKITSEAERLRQDFLKLKEGMQQEQRQEGMQQEQRQELGMDDDEEAGREQEKQQVVKVECSTQTEQLAQRQLVQCSAQTIPFSQNKPPPLGLQEMQQLVAKYSSAFTVACGKVKQNHYLKDKFDRQIFNIVDSVVKDSVQPFLEARFIALLQEKVKEISQHISTVFEGQLQGLNQLMRRDEAKENNLRGRRIFQFANQVAYIRDSVSSLADALKANQMHKHSFNSLLLEQAREMREQIAKVTAALGQIQSKWQASDKEVSAQVGEIFQMMRALEQRQRENAEDSVSSSEEGLGEEQREVATSESGESESSGSQAEREEVHQRYPQHYPRGGQEHKKNKKSFDAFDSQGYPAPYPAPEYYHAPPPQMPYYYPLMHSPPTIPMHGYYHRANYPFPAASEESGKMQARRRAKKSKKASD